MANPFGISYEDYLTNKKNFPAVNMNSNNRDPSCHSNKRIISPSSSKDDSNAKRTKQPENVHTTEDVLSPQAYQGMCNITRCHDSHSFETELLRVTEAAERKETIHSSAKKKPASPEVKFLATSYANGASAIKIKALDDKTFV